MHLVSESAQDTQKIAAMLAEKVRAAMPGTQATVIALDGELGTGKTTFTQGFAATLGVTHIPRSPTFNLAKEYPIPGTPWKLWHLDCYRLNGHADAITLDLHTMFAQPNNIILVEWPERIGDALPRDHIVVRFAHGGGDKRALTLPQ